jgi:hypothetical protein
MCRRINIKRLQHRTTSKLIKAQCPPFKALSLQQYRMHIHIHHPDGEAKFWLKPTIELAQNFGLSSQELREIESLVKLIEQLFHVERPLPHHLYWPELDIDLHVDSIRHPEKFPLISQTTKAQDVTNGSEPHKPRLSPSD